MSEILDRTIAAILDDYSSKLNASVPWVIENTESPIEAAFWIAAGYVARHSDYCGEIEFARQQSIGRFRVDFVMSLRGQKFVVECDGHDFHDKTKEQAEHDKSRDRYLTDQGYRVIRFTGREIWRDALGCARQAVAIIEKAYHDHSHAVHLAGGQS